MSGHNERKLPVVNTTCFAEHKRHNVHCNRRSCRDWIPHEESHNCCLIAAASGPLTLEKVGNIFDLTRMRICQVEKSIIQRFRDAVVDQASSAC